MIDLFLRSKLDRVIRRYQWIAFWRMLAACWAGVALLGAGMVGLERAFGWSVPGGALTIGFLAVSMAVSLTLWQWRQRPSYHWVSRRIEKTFPDLNGVLLTAVEQPVDDASPDFLRQRVVHEAIARSQKQNWRKTFPPQRLLVTQVVHLAALGCLAVVLVGLHRADRARPARGQRVAPADGVTINPGDATLERGDTLVVLARFGGTVPADVAMAVRESGAAPRSIPLVKSLSDPVFGATLPNVQQDFTYRVSYGASQSRDFTVKVFEHPRLLRSDVTLTFPEYTGQREKQIRDTTRISTVEGTRIDLALHLNKPVKTAQLVARDPAKTAVSIGTKPGEPDAALTGWIPAKGGTYDLVLIDEDNRKNKAGPAFVIDVQPNRPPEIRLTAPRGDVRPSALEEVTFDGTVWDDFGTLAYGVSYTIGDGAEKSIELGRGVAAKERKSFHHVLDLEAAGVKPDDLVAWHVWAEDIGPDGKPRRTPGDLFFAEIRPFEEIFRELQMQASEQSQSGQGQGEGTQRLVELQKQIITATWNLQKGGTPPKKDAEVVRDSQRQALQLAQRAAEQVRNPRQKGLWSGVTRDMESAVTKLAAAADASGALSEALPPEQSAYQTLLRLQARETQVTRGQRGRSGSGRQQASQRQLDQLDLQQADKRYETQRQARPQQNPQQREQLGVINRLQDLARRQQDLNARLQELQTSLQEAKNEQEKEELRQRLKRLEEEQRQMLADADELRQRMDRAENQSALSQQKQQLDQARDDLQRAADAASQGSPAQALSSGTRAQRQLQQARDELRQQSSSRLAEDLREMRGEAREVARQQEQLDRKLAGTDQAPRSRKTLSAADRDPDLAEQVEQQRDRWNRLYDRAKQMSEEAENTEPLVAKNLYDSVRKATQADDASVTQLQQDLLGRGELTYDMRERLADAAKSEKPGKALELTREMLREGNLPAAGESSRRAATQVEEMRRGVERAAESVLGDDAEQLKLAQAELDQLTDQLRREMAGENGSPSEKADAKAGGGNQKGGERRGERVADAAEKGAGASADPRDEQADPNAKSPGQRSPQSGKSGQRGQPGQAQANAGAGEQAGQAQADGSAPEQGQRGQRQPGQRQGGRQAGRGGIDDILDGIAQNDAVGGGAEGGGVGGRGATGMRPLTGEAFGPWTDRLRDVEQLLDSPDLRDRLSSVRERARAIRRDFTQTKKKPDWAVVELQVVKPLVEVRNRVAEDLARRETRESLAPIDHDPVPTRFAESVRRYYEELGKDAPPSPAARSN